MSQFISPPPPSGMPCHARDVGFRGATEIYTVCFFVCLLGGQAGRQATRPRPAGCASRTDSSSLDEKHDSFIHLNLLACVHFRQRSRGPGPAPLQEIMQAQSLLTGPDDVCDCAQPSTALDPTIPLAVESTANGFVARLSCAKDPVDEPGPSRLTCPPKQMYVVLQRKRTVHEREREKEN